MWRRRIITRTRNSRTCGLARTEATILWPPVQGNCADHEQGLVFRPSPTKLSARREMTDSHAPFPKPVQKEALERQRRRCASCRTIITGLGRSGAQQHVFGEGVEAHHVIRSEEHTSELQSRGH